MTVVRTTISTVVAVVSLTSATASALEPLRLGDQTVEVDVTNASSVLYNFDNRDTKPNSVQTLANDHWGMWYNRLNLQAAAGEWTAGVRVDNAWFYVSPHPAEIALELTRMRAAGGPLDASYFQAKHQEAGIELSNRYINWAYPAKYYLGWTTRDIEATAGDFYAALGRGLVLSVRKLDELSSDTTVRGARLTGRLRFGDAQLRLTALGGTMNPLRIDEASGRYLASDASVRSGVTAVTEAGMPTAIATDYVVATSECATFATCTYAPDRIAAGQIEAGGRTLKLAVQGSLLARQDGAPIADPQFTPLSGDTVRSAQTVKTGSVSVELPDLGGHGVGYLEAALQGRDYPTEPSQADCASSSPPAAACEKSGHAVYGSLTLIELPVTLTLEGKHYRRFYPLSANVKTDRAQEFSLVQYSAPPTAEAFYVDTLFGNFNTCTTGGRLKSDVAVGKDQSVFAWVGRYYTWGELNTGLCEVNDAFLNRVWDVATGFEITSQGRRSRAAFTIGARVDDTAEPIASSGGTRIFYQENYARYDIIRALDGPWSLQFQGWHRRRHETVGGPGEPWFEGFHLSGVSFAPHLSVAFGIEYATRPDIPPTYFNGQVAWKFTSDTSLALFVGQRRGALRCVGGVCRVFPPFEGARADFTARF